MWPWAARFVDHGLMLDHAVALPACLQHTASLLPRAACPTQGTVYWPTCVVCLFPLPHLHLNLRKELLSVAPAGGQWPPQPGSPRHSPGAVGTHVLCRLPDNSSIPQSLFVSAGPLTQQLALPTEPLLDKVSLTCVGSGLCSVPSRAAAAVHEEGRPQLWPGSAACHAPRAGGAKAAVSARGSSQQLLKSHSMCYPPSSVLCLTACLPSPAVSVCTCSRLQPPAGQPCNDRGSQGPGNRCTVGQAA